MAGLNVILGVSGSIAAYKSLLLTRLLIKNGCQVRVIMTEAATEFVSALSFATLSKSKVHVNIIEGDSWSDHVSLGLWADLMLIAPATATTLSKLAHGHADNMLVATYLSAKCPVMVAPAMDLDMWRHPSTSHNLELLRSYGNSVIPVGHGELASGLVGDGRMAEPEEIIAHISKFDKAKRDLAGKRVLITAGPTQEPIDPVRYITNHSTGKMGISIAEAAAARGADVTLVLGPTSESIEASDRLKVIRVSTAQSMYEACRVHHEKMDLVVFAAAVADYTPKDTSQHKMKKSESDLSIPLRRTIDIAATLGRNKSEGQTHIGFALETEEGMTNAESKLIRKNFDFIVLNSLQNPGAGFGHDTNQVTIISPNKTEELSLRPKRELADDILDLVVEDKSEVQ
ncbi:MAG: bifunctional phosphopantothenoylcysteine decarboxylase/phosphopantothenate--cysteine ligase CoaBC [Bacteroidota bacterium]